MWLLVGRCIQWYWISGDINIYAMQDGDLFFIETIPFERGLPIEISPYEWDRVMNTLVPVLWRYPIHWRCRPVLLICSIPIDRLPWVQVWPPELLLPVNENLAVLSLRGLCIWLTPMLHFQYNQMDHKRLFKGVITNSDNCSVHPMGVESHFIDMWYMATKFRPLYSVCKVTSHELGFILLAWVLPKLDCLSMPLIFVLAYRQCRPVRE